MDRRKIVIGNWKMNKTWEEGLELFNAIDDLLKIKPAKDIVVAVAPSYLFIQEFTRRGGRIKIAAQNCSQEASGAFTGEVSAVLIKSAGASHVIIGHSERRTYFKETNEVLFKKTEQALACGLIPVFCLGETSSQRANSQHFETIQNQLEEGLYKLPSGSFSQLAIAYEPVWAIGTGVTATSSQAQEMHLFIRNSIKEKYSPAISEACSIIYGGSCTAQNANELFGCQDVDGGLIGGASLKAPDFMQIIHSF